MQRRPVTQVREEITGGGPPTRSARSLSIANDVPGGRPSPESGSDEVRVRFIEDREGKRPAQQEI
eukprot:14796882-Alexandrium_andersonii.AAC.1